MKYQQPYGVSDPNAPYINGNPSTGTMGSIPPAASIEFPQREVVNFISDARGVPDNADLHQLSKAVQSGQVIYGDDGGTVNQVVITPSPPVLALVKGMVFVTKIANPNTGPCTLKVSSLPPVPIVHASDQTALAAGELAANSMQAFGFDGANFQRVWVQSSGGGGGAAPVYLAAPRDFYVNGTTGSDANDGVAAVVGGGHGPFKTIQKACDQVPKYNLNGFKITINVADGAYSNFQVPAVNGSGGIWLIGNHTNPGNVVVSAVNSGDAADFYCKTACYIDGFRLQASGSFPGSAISGLVAYGAGTYLFVDNIDFGACVGWHMSASMGGALENKNPGSQWRIFGSAGGFCWILGRSQIAMNGYGGPAITIMNPINYSGSFLKCELQCWAQLLYQSLSGGGNVTGRTYWVTSNSFIGVSGAGPNYYPGTVAGYADGASGGYYA